MQPLHTDYPLAVASEGSYSVTAVYRGLSIGDDPDRELDSYHKSDHYRQAAGL